MKRCMLRHYFEGWFVSRFLSLGTFYIAGVSQVSRDYTPGVRLPTNGRQRFRKEQGDPGFTVDEVPTQGIDKVVARGP